MIRTDKVKDHEWLNSIQDEITSVIESSQMRLEARNDQLLQSILNLLSQETRVPKKVDPSQSVFSFIFTYSFIQNESEEKIYCYALSNKND